MKADSLIRIGRPSKPPKWKAGSSPFSMRRRTVEIETPRRSATALTSSSGSFALVALGMVDKVCASRLSAQWSRSRRIRAEIGGS